ncbi:Hypothetical protein HVR_LOCUS386 [uncultured virus]|nr:Hypothetical protein HVR_LOCUS386 [uncultured virus]
MDVTEQVYDDGRIGLLCKVNGPLKDTDVIEYFNRLRDRNIFSITPRFKKKEIDLMIFDTPDNLNHLRAVLEVINSDDDELLSRNRWVRGICYNLCKLYGHRFEKIVEHGRKYVGCNEYLPKNANPWDGCGCEHAPEKFHKYHVGNSYNDDIAYSNIPYTYKLGVRIIRK